MRGREDVTFGFSDFSVTTLRKHFDGQWVWLARSKEKPDEPVEFVASSRDAPVDELIRLGRQALGLSASQD